MIHSTPFRLAVALTALTATARAQTLSHVVIDAPAPTELADRLERVGFDVEPGPGRIDAYVTDAEFIELRSLGLAPRLLERGQPFRTLQGSAVDLNGTVPPGYQDLTEIEARMAQVAVDHPLIAEFVDLSARFGAPLTSEGRSLKAVRISGNVGSDEDEPAVLVASAHHCRELVTPVIALEAIDRLTDDYGSVPSITAAVDAHDIWIIPVCNPDGYEHVFNVDNFWRKNRRPFGGGDFGVDLNRNYPQGWSNTCSGSSNPSSSTYKGPSAASEAETQAILALSNDRRFAKVIDVHSRGREVLWGYDCPTHPFDDYYEDEAIAVAQAAGYGGAVRRPSADGEHQQWHHGRRGAWAVLIETATEFQPDYADALAEAAQVVPAVEWLLERAVPASGRVTDACSGAPLEASITLVGASLPAGEENGSGGAFGRWHANLPPGSHTLRFEAPGYAPETITVDVPPGGATTLDVALVGGSIEPYCVGTPNSTGQVGGVEFVGSTSVSANTAALVATGLPPNEFCLFVYGQTEVQLPLFDGFLCLSDPIVRLGIVNADPFGVAGTSLDLANPPQSVGLITGGTTWNFQAYYRDSGFGANGANLTRGLRVPFCP